jgi:pilus assembly protein Flp/PilA
VNLWCRRILSLEPTRREAGATAVEYALLVALIAGVIIVTVAALGQQVVGLFNLVIGRF